MQTVTNPEVELRSGRLRGLRHDAVDVFYGVAYAAPPLGQNRWRLPQPEAPWTGVRDATSKTSSAMQTAPAPGRFLIDLGETNTSEDCLYLNIWTPRADGAQRPVMVWLHGGAFVAGSANLDAYDGAALAERGDVVVVGVNYRLGLFGWLRNPSLGTTGNEGLADQWAALEWVRANIAAFGGDPANVTVFGESAGATSIAAHLCPPPGVVRRRPFDRAILQSGGHHLIITRSAAERANERVMEHLGNPSEAELYALSAQELIAAQDAATPRSAGVFYGPLRDGVVVAVDTVDVLTNGSAAGVPLLVGSNREEMGFFWGRNPDFDVVDDFVLNALIGKIAGANQNRIVEGYRAARAARGEPVDLRSLAVAISSDGTFRNGVDQLGVTQAAHAPVWCYLFQWRSPLYEGLIGAAHVLDVPFVLGNHRQPACADFVGDDPAADALAATMMDAWADFARTGTVNWSQFDGQRRATMVFDSVSQEHDDPLAPERRAWAGDLGIDPRRS